MLLLPILLLWAREPMYFPLNLLRCLIPTTLFIAFSSPFSGIDCDNHVSAADRNGSHRNAVSDNVAVDHPASFSIATTNAQSSTATSLLQGSVREGTLTPPLTGRFVLVGRRWAFAPNQDANATGVISNAPFTSTEGRGRLTPTNSLGLSSVTSVTDSASAMEDSSDQRVAADQASGLLVIENLMLQRIVKAIREDQNDNQWTITAKVTEYFEENQLILLTAQRATNKQASVRRLDRN